MSIFIIASPVLAHPDVNQGREYYDQAEFQKAIAAFDRAQRSRSITFDDLTDVLLGRALAHQALGDERAAREDFEALLSIAPDTELDDNIPPSRRKMFSEVKRKQRGALNVEVRAKSIPDGVRLEADVERDPVRLVQTVRINYREGSGRWQVEEASSVNVPADDTIEYFAEAIGPGGTVLARDGNEDEPREFKVRSVRSSDDLEPDPEDPAARGSGNRGLIVGISVGAALLIGIIVAIVVLTGSTSTQPSAPMLVN